MLHFGKTGVGPWANIHIEPCAERTIAQPERLTDLSFDPVAFMRFAELPNNRHSQARIDHLIDSGIYDDVFADKAGGMARNRAVLLFSC